MTCADGAFDVPDVPPSAYRWPDGNVTMIASNRLNLRLDGPLLDHVTRRGCDSLLRSAGRDDPAAFSDQEWLTALYSKDGRYVLGLVHNEYHGFKRNPDACDRSSQKTLECWYASATFVESRNGGVTWTRPLPPANVILSLPEAYRPGMKRAGVFMPKPVGGTDGHLYVLASLVDRNRNIRISQCLARRIPEDGKPWEVWTGQSFETLDVSPYGCAGTCTGRRKACQPVLAYNVFSVKHVPAKDVYVALGVSGTSVAYMTSKDLIAWSDPRTLLTMPLFPLWEPGEERPGWYFSLLDPASGSRNFDTLEARPYLYIVKFRVKGGALDLARRDLVRIPLRLE